MGSHTIQRLGLALVFAAGLTMSLLYLQGLFDRADEKKAVAQLLAYVPRGGLTSVGEALLARGHAPQCSASVTSRLRGKVTVSCLASTAQKPLQFEIDFGGSTPRPLDESANELLRTLARTAPPP